MSTPSCIRNLSQEPPPPSSSSSPTSPSQFSSSQLTPPFPHRFFHDILVEIDDPTISAHLLASLHHSTRFFGKKFTQCLHQGTKASETPNTQQSFENQPVIDQEVKTLQEIVFSNFSLITSTTKSSLISTGAKSPHGPNLKRKTTGYGFQHVCHRPGDDLDDNISLYQNAIMIDGKEEENVERNEEESSKEKYNPLSSFTNDPTELEPKMFPLPLDTTSWATNDISQRAVLKLLLNGRITHLSTLGLDFDWKVDTSSSTFIKPKVFMYGYELQSSSLETLIDKMNQECIDTPQSSTTLNQRYHLSLSLQSMINLKQLRLSSLHPKGYDDSLISDIFSIPDNHINNTFGNTNSNVDNKNEEEMKEEEKNRLRTITFPHLESLSLPGSYNHSLNRHDYDHLAKYTSFPKLKSLDLCANGLYLEDIGVISLLSWLDTMKELKVLNLTHCRFSPSAMSLFGSSPILSRLSILYLPLTSDNKGWCDRYPNELTGSKSLQNVKLLYINLIP